MPGAPRRGRVFVAVATKISFPADEQRREEVVSESERGTGDDGQRQHHPLSPAVMLAILDPLSSFAHQVLACSSSRVLLSYKHYD